MNSSNISYLDQCPGSATYSKQVNKLYFKIQKHKKDKTAQIQQHWIQWLVNSTFLPFLTLQGNHQNSSPHSEQWGRKWYLVTKASSLVHKQQVRYNFLHMLEYPRRGPQGITLTVEIIKQDKQSWIQIWTKLTQMPPQHTYHKKIYSYFQVWGCYYGVNMTGSTKPCIKVWSLM